MARLPYPDLKTLASDTQEFLRKLPALNIFRMMAGGEGLLPVFVRLGNYLLYKSKLDPILREIAIIRVGVFSRRKPCGTSITNSSPKCRRSRVITAEAPAWSMPMRLICTAFARIVMMKSTIASWSTIEPIVAVRCPSFSHCG